MWYWASLPQTFNLDNGDNTKNYFGAIVRPWNCAWHRTNFP